MGGGHKKDHHDDDHGHGGHDDHGHAGHDGHGHGGHDGHGHDDGHGDHHDHHHPHYSARMELFDHLRQPAEQIKDAPITFETDDPWGHTYSDYFVNLPPLKWFHHKLRRHFGAAAEVPDKIVQDYWKMMPQMWLPKWRMFRFDTHAWKYPWKLKGSHIGFLTGGNYTDDFILAQMVNEFEKVEDYEQLAAFLENELFRCKESLYNQTQLTDHRYVRPTRGTQITHRNCVFDVVSKAIEAGHIKDRAIDIPSGWVPAGWWNVWRRSTAGPAGPIAHILYSKWWANESRKNEEMWALQMETKAVVGVLQSEELQNVETIAGQPRDLFLARVEKHYREVLIPHQKKLFPQTVFGRDNGHNRHACPAKEARLRDAFFQNLWKTGDYTVDTSPSNMPWFYTKPRFLFNPVADYYTNAALHGERSSAYSL